MEKLEKLQQICQQKGLRLTIQKRAVLENIANRNDHPTADEVFKDVQEKLPGISRATVYRLLDSFVQEGVIQKISHPDSACHYDANTDHHHHLLCTQCSQIMDIEIPSKGNFNIQSIPAKGFKILDFTIYFRGICLDCQNRLN